MDVIFGGTDFRGVGGGGMSESMDREDGSFSGAGSDFSDRRGSFGNCLCAIIGLTTPIVG